MTLIQTRRQRINRMLREAETIFQFIDDQNGWTITVDCPEDLVESICEHVGFDLDDEKDLVYVDKLVTKLMDTKGGK